MTVQERKTIFAMCKELGIDEENRHALTNSVTGKSSLTELSESEASAVIRELMDRMKLSNRTAPLEERKPKAYSAQVAGMMTPEQQSLAWRLIYRLRELDPNPSRANPAERMCGAIKRELGITAVPGKSVFVWVSFDDGVKLIEKLKRYVRSAERKAERRTG